MQLFISDACRQAIYLLFWDFPKKPRKQLATFIFIKVLKLRLFGELNGGKWAVTNSVDIRQQQS